MCHLALLGIKGLNWDEASRKILIIVSLSGIVLTSLKRILIIFIHFKKNDHTIIELYEYDVLHKLDFGTHMYYLKKAASIPV